MKLYQQENLRIILQTQNQDPFFDYLTEKTMRLLDGKLPGRLVDLGCGSGRICIAAAKKGWNVVGVDANEKAIINAKLWAKHEGVSKQILFYLSEIEKLNKKKIGLFDICTMQEVIEHVEDYQKLIDVAYNLLKPGGKLILTTPHDPKQWTLLDDYAEHIRRFTIPQIRNAMSTFKDVEVMTISFPVRRYVTVMYDLLMRMLKQDHQGKYFRQSPVVRKAYYAVGWLAVHIDDLFNGTPWGTTIWTVGTKRAL